MRRWPFGPRSVILAASVVLLTGYCCRLEFSPDGVHYADIARTVASSGQVATYHLTLDSRRVPDTNLFWPPMYPLLLALPVKLGLPVQAAASVIAVASLAGALGLLLLMLRRVEWMVLAGVLWLYLAAVCRVEQAALSEAPFVALVMASLYCLRRGRGVGSWSALLAGGLAGAAALTRWVGLPLILVGVLALLARARSAEATRRGSLVYALLFLLGAAVIVAPWLLRNESLNGSLFGPARAGGGAPVMSVVTDLGKSLFFDFGLFAVVLVVTWAGGRDGNGAGPPCGRCGPSNTAPALIAGVWALAYVVEVLALKLKVAGIDPLGHRLLYPGYAMALTAGLLVLDRTRGLEADQARRLRWLIIVAVPLLLAPLGNALSISEPGPKAAVSGWVRAQTTPNTLLIGDRVWAVRFRTGRPTLEGGAPGTLSVVTHASRVHAFLNRFGSRFEGAVVVVEEPERGPMLEAYREAMMTVRLVHREGGVWVYEVSH